MRASNLDHAELLRQISHAFRAPVGSIFNLTSLLKLGLEGDISEEALQAVATIDKDAHRLYAAIEAAFDIIESYATPLNYRPFDLTAVVNDAAAKLIEQSQSTGKTVSVQALAELPFVRGDPDNVIRVILKLGSHVLHFVSGESVAIRLSVELDQAVVSIGEDQPQLDINEPLLALSDEHIKASLSLPILFSSHSIAQQGGLLWASKSPSGGLIWNFSLPLARTEENTPEK